ncbi:MAG: CRISPR-associated protein [Bacteroides sp.]|nr:CRISPR-associated protein [Bacteroides sp.]
MDIEYKVDFFTDWHCGSGLAAGADVDALVIKNGKGLPYIPGKTVKGLLREAIEDIITFYGGKEDPRNQSLYQYFIEAFGIFIDNTDNPDLKNVMERGNAFFTNAELPKDAQDIIESEKLYPYIYRTLSSTAIDPNGIAVDHSLRRIEVAVPCTLYGKILGLPDDGEFNKLVADGLSYIKRLGQNRNRGLGRCSFTIVNKTAPTQNK